MAVLKYIDNEVPGFGEWDSKVESGGSTISQLAAASFPDRGTVGLRTDIVDDAAAYVQSATLGQSLAAGGSIFLGMWLNLRTTLTEADSSDFCTLKNAAGELLALAFVAEDTVSIYAPGESGDTGYVDGIFLPPGWVYFVLEVVRASAAGARNGRVRMYLDGSLVGQSEDYYNYARAATAGRFTAGGTDPAGNLTFDTDEVKAATTYPEPYVPPPLTAYPEARRTVLLFRHGSAESGQFADYCAEQLGIPRANLCLLPNASADETLADYATFQAEVETDLLAWLGRNSTTAAQAAILLIGYGVPGMFISGGDGISATSRLMNLGNAFSKQVANPLYAPATVARLTAAALQASECYLCTRIDADTLAHAEAILTAGLAVSALTVLPSTDVLYGDDAAYRATVPCQHLRMIAADLDTFVQDAFAFGDIGETGAAFGAAGTRAAYLDSNSDDREPSLRYSGTPDFCLARALITHGYAAGMNAVTDDADETWDAASFFEMQRIGGTFAEACLVAAQYLDYSAQPAGDPLMTVAFERGGYNVYQGIGSPEAIDWDSPVAHLRPGATTPTLRFCAAPGERHVFGARSVSGRGIEEHNTHVHTFVELDNLGELLPAPLCQPVDLTTEVMPIGSVLLSFSHRAPLGYRSPEAFDVFTDNGSGSLDLDDPIAVITDFAADSEEFEVVVSPASLPAKFAVRARAGQQDGPLSDVVTAATAPAPHCAETL